MKKLLLILVFVFSLYGQKISDLPELSATPADDDILVIVDTSLTQTRYITWANIKAFGVDHTISSVSTLTNKVLNTASNTITVVEADISDLSHTAAADHTISSVSTLTNKVIDTAANTITVVQADISDLSHVVADDTITTAKLSDVADSPIAGECVVVATGGLNVEYITCPGSTVTSFTTIDVPSGTDPLASASDTLIITVDSAFTLTGTASTDTIAFTHTALVGDVSGLPGATVVANDSHTHNDTTVDGLNTSATTAGQFVLARLPNGTANQLIKTNAGATAQEHLTLSAEAGNELSVTFGIGTIVIDAIEANFDLAAIGGTLGTGQAAIDFRLESEEHAGTDPTADLEEEGQVNATVVTGNAADDQILLGSGVSAAAYAAIPDCNTGSSLSYTAVTNTFSCEAAGVLLADSPTWTDDHIWQSGVDSITGHQFLDADGGTPILNVDSTNERVGIGTASPGSLLQVGSGTPLYSGSGQVDIVGANISLVTALTQLSVYSTDAIALDKGGTIGLGGAGGGNPYIFATIAGRSENNVYAGYLQFGTVASSGALSEWMRITSTGNVGIGTAAPTATLHVKDTTATTGDTSVIFQEGAGQSGAILNVQNNAGTSYMAFPAGGGIDTTTGTITYADSANVASATTTALTAGNLFHITGTTTITTLNTCDAANNGREVVLIFDDILTLTDGGNLKIAGNFATTADDTINLWCDGTNWYESGARSVN